MGKFILFILSVLILSYTSLEAAVYKGQKIFVKKCAVCHKKKLHFIKTLTTSQWEDYMEDKGKPLASIHLDSEDAKDSWKYFKSKKYHKKSKHLRDFLLEYAQDSGNVPACN